MFSRNELCSLGDLNYKHLSLSALVPSRFVRYLHSYGNQDLLD